MAHRLSRTSTAAVRVAPRPPRSMTRAATASTTTATVSSTRASSSPRRAAARVRARRAGRDVRGRRRIERCTPGVALASTDDLARIGIDDDCDGQLDEDAPRCGDTGPLTLGPARTRAFGPGGLGHVTVRLGRRGCSGRACRRAVRSRRGRGSRRLRGEHRGDRALSRCKWDPAPPAAAARAACRCGRPERGLGGRAEARAARARGRSAGALSPRFPGATLLWRRRRRTGRGGLGESGVAGGAARRVLPSPTVS